MANGTAKGLPGAHHVSLRQCLCICERQRRPPLLESYPELFYSSQQPKKYWRGSWGGPVKRDYGNFKPWAGSAAATSIYFGDYPGEPHHERDTSLFINSGYKPPAAVVALARRQFERPVEIFSSHPTYEVMLPEMTKSGNSLKRCTTATPIRLAP